MGVILDGGGSYEPCFEVARRAAWQACYANIKPLVKDRLRPMEVLSQMDRAIRPALTYRAPRWPFTPTRALKLDRLQNAMVARAVQCTPLPGDTAATYVRRRSRVAAAHCRQHGKWSHSYSACLLKWQAHLHRHPEAWTSRILRFQDAAWLQERRVQLATEHGSALTGRTDTRAAKGHVARRWEASTVNL